MSHEVPPAAGPSAGPSVGPSAGPGAGSTAGPPLVVEPPPILGSWARMYLLVLLVLAVAVLLFAWLTWSYS